MATVDPYEAVIALAMADSALYSRVAGRIAQQHRYGQGSTDWPLDAGALVMLPAAGAPHLSAAVQRFQLEARCYADTPYKAGQIWRDLVAFSRVNDRRVATVSEGSALVYYVVIRAEPRLIIDDEIRPRGMPAYLALLEAAVSENLI